MVKLGALISPKHSPKKLIDIAEHLEKLSINSFWYPDEKFFRDSYIGLTLVCTHTKSIRCGICVTDPYSRHPIMTAASIASLAEIAPGRVWLGIGAGGRGFSAMGIDREKPVVAIREAVAIIRKLLAGECVEYNGEVITLIQRSLDFSPPPEIKILIATGYGKLIKRLAGEIADAVMLANVTSEAGIMAGVKQIKIGAQKAGRRLKDFELISRIDVSVNENEKLAKAAIAPKILSTLRASYPKLTYLDHMDNVELSTELINVLEQRDYISRSYYANPKHSAHLISDPLYDHFAIAGTPDYVKNRLQELVSLELFTEIAINPIASGDQNILETIAMVKCIFDTIARSN